MSDRPAPEPLSRLTIGISVALAGLLVAGMIVAGTLLGASGNEHPTPSPSRTGPVALVPVDAPDAGSPACARLLEALPVELTSGSTILRRRALAQPAPRATMVWGSETGDPVVLRCGLARPPELTQTSELREISGVRWLPVQGDGASTWYVVDRPVYVALTMPAGTGTGVLQGVSESVGSALASP